MSARVIGKSLCNLRARYAQVWAEEHAATDLYVIDTAVENVIAQCFGADSEHLRGSGDIKETLKLLPALQ